MAILFNAGRFKATDKSNLPIPGAFLSFYATLTSTPQPVYSDSELSVLLANPVQADANGLFPEIWLDETLAPYKVVFASPDVNNTQLPGVTIWSIQKYNPSFSAGAGDVRLFGAKGDGVTDSTAGILAAIGALVPGGTLDFEPNGTYLVHVNNSHTLLFSNKTNFLIRGNNATIKVFDNDPVTGNNEVLFFTGCTDGTVENLIIDGNRANRPLGPLVPAHNVDIRDNCQRLTFRKIRSINAVMDGFVVDTSSESMQSTYPTDILLEDCDASNSYRNGLSIVASNRLTVRGGRYHDSIGTAPQCGIDIEPNPTTTFGNTDTLLQGVNVSANAGFGVQLAVSGGTLLNFRPRIRGLGGSSNAAGLMNIAVGQDIEIDGVEIGPHNTATRGLLDLPTGGNLINVTVRNVICSSQLALTGSNYVIFDQGAVSGRLTIQNFKAYNIACHAIATNSDASLQGIVVNSCTADPAITVSGGLTDIRDTTVDTQTGRGFYASVAVHVDGLSLFDCSSTTGSAQFDAGSAGAAVKNVDIQQRTAIPSGAVGIYFNDAPRIVENVSARSAGTDYTSANIFNFAGGTAGALIAACTPHPFRISVSITPGTVSSGGVYTQSIAFAGISANDILQAMPGVDLGGLVWSLSYQTANTVRLAIANNTGSGNAPGTSNWIFWAQKHP
jgi:hypothetical protein